MSEYPGCHVILTPNGDEGDSRLASKVRSLLIQYPTAGIKCWIQVDRVSGFPYDYRSLCDLLTKKRIWQQEARLLVNECLYSKRIPARLNSILSAQWHKLEDGKCEDVFGLKDLEKPETKRVLQVRSENLTIFRDRVTFEIQLGYLIATLYLEECFLNIKERDVDFAHCCFKEHLRSLSTTLESVTGLIASEITKSHFNDPYSLLIVPRGTQHECILLPKLEKNKVPLTVVRTEDEALPNLKAKLLKHYLSESSVDLDERRRLDTVCFYHAILKLNQDVEIEKRLWHRISRLTLEESRDLLKITPELSINRREEMVQAFVSFLK